MAYASLSGKARTSAKSPRAHAICDRCGGRFNFCDLRWQMDWRGVTIQNLRILVCPRCVDEPQEQLRALTLPADPEPIINARVQDFTVAENNYRAASIPSAVHPITGLPVQSDLLRVTEDCENRTPFPFGRPVGLDANAVMPYNGALQRHLGVPLNILSVTGDGSATVTVTCSSVHGLQNFESISGTDPSPVEIGPSQVAVQGLNYAPACGFYSVNVTTATAFTYMTYGLNPAQSLLTPTTRIITALVGLPRGYKRIPKIFGPTLFAEVEAAVCFLETEDGSGVFLLEDGSGFISLEQCMQPPLGDFFFTLEDSSGDILLENGTDFLEQEQGP
jgi:hypothetical protein